MQKGTALITGASRGIGRGIAIELAQHGYHIAGCATKADPANTDSGLHEVKAKVEALGRRFLPVAGDIADLEDHARMAGEVLAAFSTIDVLVNNAGVSLLERFDVLDTTEESYDRVMNINLRGPFFFAQRIANRMLEQRAAHPKQRATIVFVTSVSADTASTNRAEYCISKAGLSMAAQTFAVRLATDGINVYELRPGIIDTDMTSGAKDKYDDQIAKGLTLQKRWGTPQDVGKACAALAEGYFDYATGAVIEIGGGLSVRRL